MSDVLKERPEEEEGRKELERESEKKENEGKKRIDSWGYDPVPSDTEREDRDGKSSFRNKKEEKSIEF